jgi:Ca2+-binding EF-hand superfamily protein
MLSFELQDKLMKYLKYVSNFQNEINLKKIKLYNNENFNIKKIFYFLDNSSKGFINQEDLFKYFTKRLFYCNYFELKNLIMFYDSEQKNIISFKDFCYLILPDEIKLSETIKNFSEIKDLNK